MSLPPPPFCDEASQYASQKNPVTAFWVSQYFQKSCFPTMAYCIFCDMSQFTTPPPHPHPLSGAQIRSITGGGGANQRGMHPGMMLVVPGACWTDAVASQCPLDECRSWCRLDRYCQFVVQSRWMLLIRSGPWIDSVGPEKKKKAKVGEGWVEAGESPFCKKWFLRTGATMGQVCCTAMGSNCACHHGLHCSQFTVPETVPHVRCLKVLWLGAGTLFSAVPD